MFRFQSLSEIRHDVSTRHGGVSRPPYDTLNVGYGTPDDEATIAANRATLLDRMGVPPETVLAARLTHGNEVSLLRSGREKDWGVELRPVRHGSSRVERFFSTDGVVSDVTGLHFLLTFADCVPLLFHDPVRGVLGAAHAGWRGTAAGVGQAIVETMVRSFGCRAGDIVAGIGPCIGPCCYSVREDVPATFALQRREPVVERRGGRLHLDLARTNERQLRNCGVRAVEQAGICTACNTHTFYSHRGEDGRTGRFAVVAGLPAA